MKGSVIVGLNRQLNNQAATRAAAIQAKNTMGNLFAIELGNEPECKVHHSLWRTSWNLQRDLLSLDTVYASSSPIIPSGQSWNQDTDAASEKSWFTALSPSVKPHET